MLIAEGKKGGRISLVLFSVFPPPHPTSYWLTGCSRGGNGEGQYSSPATTTGRQCREGVRPSRGGAQDNFECVEALLPCAYL